MHILQPGQPVFLLRFLPDGRHLLVGTIAALDALGTVSFAVWPLAGGEPVRLQLPADLHLAAWWYNARHGNVVAVHPDGERCYLAWGGRLFTCKTTDGSPLPVPAGVTPNQLVISPDGTRLIAGLDCQSDKQLLTRIALDGQGKVVRKTPLPAAFRHVAGFLPDNERFVTIDRKVRIHTFTDDTEQASANYPTYNAHHPQLSPDGRYLGVIGYASMYVYDLTALGKPRRIGGTQSCGDFVGFAFHPDGRSLAVIYGGPTLVKIYDLGTLKQTHKYHWKLGPLGCVAYSPDGTLGAAGSQDGRIVVWDEDG